MDDWLHAPTVPGKDPVTFGTTLRFSEFHQSSFPEGIKNVVSMTIARIVLPVGVVLLFLPPFFVVSLEIPRRL